MSCIRIILRYIKYLFVRKGLKVLRFSRIKEDTSWLEDVHPLVGFGSFYISTYRNRSYVWHGFDVNKHIRPSLQYEDADIYPRGRLYYYED